MTSNNNPEENKPFSIGYSLTQLICKKCYDVIELDALRIAPKVPVRTCSFHLFSSQIFFVFPSHQSLMASGLILGITPNAFSSHLHSQNTGIKSKTST
jgi:hypothetical protein